MIHQGTYSRKDLQEYYQMIKCIQTQNRKISKKHGVKYD